MTRPELPLRRPCSLDWDELERTDDPTERWCAGCRKTVIDSTALTEEQFRARAESGPTCAFVAVRPDGSMVHRPTPLQRRRRFLGRVVAAAGPLLLAACRDRAEQGSAEDTAPVAGSDLDDDCTPSRAGSLADQELRNSLSGLGYI